MNFTLTFMNQFNRIRLNEVINVAAGMPKMLQAKFPIFRLNIS